MKLRHLSWKRKTELPFRPSKITDDIMRMCVVAEPIALRTFNVVIVVG